MMLEKHRELRKWFYGLIVAAGPLVIFYGLASSEEVALWIGVGATILGLPGGATALSNLTPEGEGTAVIEAGDVSEEVFPEVL